MANVHTVPGRRPSMGNSSIAVTGKQDPVHQKIADERRELFIQPRSMIPAWRHEAGVEPRPDINTSIQRMRNAADLQTNTAWAQPDVHINARDPSYAPSEGGAPKPRRKFSAAVHEEYVRTESVPDAAAMATVPRIGDERHRPGRGSRDSVQNTHQQYQRRVSAWRGSRMQPTQGRLKGFGPPSSI